MRSSRCSVRKAKLLVTPACLWRGARDLKRSGFPPPAWSTRGQAPACGNDGLGLSCFVVITPVHGGCGNPGEQCRCTPSRAGRLGVGFSFAQQYSERLPAEWADSIHLPVTPVRRGYSGSGWRRKDTLQGDDKIEGEKRLHVQMCLAAADIRHTLWVHGHQGRILSVIVGLDRRCGHGSR
jgi:hypothetical protein